MTPHPPEDRPEVRRKNRALAAKARSLCERLYLHRTAFTDEDGAVWPIRRCPNCRVLREALAEAPRA